VAFVVVIAVAIGVNVPVRQNKPAEEQKQFRFHKTAAPRG
jgi:hypothetical protein